MAEQFVTFEVRLGPPCPVVWQPPLDTGLVGDLRGRRSSVLLLVIDNGPFKIVWVALYAAREVHRRVYTEVEPVDALICAVCTALELLRDVGDEPAEVRS